MTEATVEVATSFGARLRDGVTDALRYLGDVFVQLSVVAGTQH